MRKFLIIAGIFFLLIVGGFFALLLSPPVHKAAFLWVLDGKVEEVSVGTVRVTPSSFMVEELSLIQDGVTVAADKAEIEASWFKVVRSRELHIDTVKLSGLEADLETFAAASGGGLGAWLDLLGESSGPFPGILASMRAPDAVSIGEVRLDGKVLLPDQQSVDLNLALDDFKRGERARVRLQGAFIDQGGLSPIDRATYELTLDLDQAADGAVNALEGTLGLILVGEVLNPSGQLDLKGTWSLSKSAAGELLSVFLAETGNETPLIDAEIDINFSSGDLQGQLAANLKGALVPEGLLDLPAFVSSSTFSTQGDVNWNYQTRVGAFDFKGAFREQAGISLVEQASYELTLNLDQAADGGVNSVEGNLGLNLIGEALNPSGKLDVNGNWSFSKNASGELLSVYLAESGKDVPIIDTKLSMNLAEGDIQGQLAANVNGALVPVDLLDLPAFISSATLSTQGDVSWNYQTGVGTFDVQGSGILEKRPLQYQFKGNGAANALPTVSGFVKTGFADEGGPGTLTVDVDLNTKGDGQVRIPVSIQRGNRVSKLAVQTDVPSLESRFDPFKISLTGDSVFLADLQSVGKALAGWAYGMQQLDTLEARAEPVVTSGVPWQGLSGDADLSIQQLILPQGHVLQGMNTKASVRPDSVSLTSFNSEIDRGTIQAKGDLIYTEKNREPYTLRVEGAINNIPSDLLDLGSGSPITGNWKGSLYMLGQAEELEGLANSVQLSLDVEGSSGLLQFSKINENADKAAKVMQLGALLGAFIQDERITAVTEMTQYLQRVPYDSIRFKVDRSADGKVAVNEFTVIGPELLLTGKGAVDAYDWASLADGALNMNLSMGTKGRFGQNAAILGLTGEQLAGDYQLWRRPINISGTLSNPNYAALKDMILGAIR